MFKSYKIDDEDQEAEIKFIREKGTVSEEEKREERRVHLNSFYFEGIQPQNSDNIFFILKGTVQDRFFPRRITYRQVCSIESALRAYPEKLIYVIFISFDNDVMFQISKSLYGLSYQNIMLTKLNIYEFMSSLAENFPHDKYLSSKHQFKHTLDIIRLFLLYKYGGTYIDNEMIVKKNVSHVKNFLCDEGYYSIIDSIMNFEQRELVEILIEDMIKNFDGNIEDQQGSILLTRVMEKLCQSPRVKMKMDRKNCEGFNILNKEICYPLDSENYWKLFDESQTDNVLEIIKNSSIVHLFNPLSKKLTKDPKTAAGQLMMQFCPNSYQLADDHDFIEFT
ncbi:hypothetical protein PVAND_001450 [Polypedilum vanderplanki]|uniref:Alpha 1,4-glycosyltransferase domain-containing protein n=1 Tax=Polypedilum vanderplanki TaxID=319348 RepID=A0A9J6BMZ5_POLVA|nr:hypothetical protein PVAND_001450 [Polypedilum vanderplanki]